MKVPAFFIAIFLCHAVAGALKSAPPPPPNIVFILADDVGYGDLGCYGATLVKTPHLDRLAREGRRFTDAHSTASTCTPTRRALLTGTYSWRQQPGSAIAPGDAALTIPAGTPTLASLVQLAGYKTGLVGKWHLGLGGEKGPDWNGEVKPGPLELGFDSSFIMAATGDRVPCVYVENHRVVGLDPADPITVSYQHKVGDEPTGRENPALLKLKHTHGHDNTIVNGIGRIGWMTGGKAARWIDEDMADTFAKQAVGFIEKHKDAPFFLLFTPHNIHVPRVPHSRFKGSSQAGTRGDALHELDAQIGEVLAALDRLKLADNTLVIFTSDNGGVNDDGYEDFDRTGSGHKMNGALRGTKGTLLEGGHRVPFLARWPAKIAAESTCDELIGLVDMPVTFAALTGTALPAKAAPDSFNVLPALLGQPHDKPARDHLVFHIGGTQGPLAIRQGAWKFIQPGQGGYGQAAKGEATAPTPRGQLYNLTDDLGETKNLVAEQPEKARELQALLQELRAHPHSRP